MKAFDLTVGITTNCRKFLKYYQTTLPVSWETCVQVKKQQLKCYMEQWTDSKWGKEYIKAVYCHLVYLCREHHVKGWAGWSTSWNQDCQEKYQQPQICRWHLSKGRKWRGTKESLMKVKDKSKKIGLKLNFQKTKVMAFVLIILWQIDGKKWK